ncbi:phosphomethylpyrimidine synthase ThiC, partial [Thermus scotoductus]|uniref:phosphomethylpyrimidine synthase ThiC n=1 Tax=Thermus scotoductus TaxID=37636 RepID=UPI0015628927
MDPIARLDRLPLGRPHLRLLFLLGLGWALDAMDVGLIGFTLPALTREFGLSPVQAGLLGSVGLLGMLLGAALGGRLADRLGRKAVIGYSLFLAGLGSLLTALAPAFKIAAHASVVARGNPRVVGVNRRMSEARYRLDWEGQFALCL